MVNGQYWEWICSWRIEVGRSGLLGPQKPPCCTLWLFISQLQPAARAQTWARQVRRKASSEQLCESWCLIWITQQIIHYESIQYFSWHKPPCQDSREWNSWEGAAVMQTVIRTTITLWQMSEGIFWGVKKSAPFSLIHTKMPEELCRLWGLSSHASARLISNTCGGLTIWGGLLAGLLTSA